MRVMHLLYDPQINIIIGSEQWRSQWIKEIEMTLVYLLLVFTGLAGAAIAKDDFVKLKAPELSNKP